MHTKNTHTPDKWVQRQLEDVCNDVFPTIGLYDNRSAAIIAVLHKVWWVRLCRVRHDPLDRLGKFRDTRTVHR